MVSIVPGEAFIDQGYDIIKLIKFQPHEQMITQFVPKDIIASESTSY